MSAGYAHLSAHEKQGRTLTGRGRIGKIEYGSPSSTTKPDAVRQQTTLRGVVCAFVRPHEE